MALTTISNGTPGTAATVDQFRQLLTGSMQDQPVTVHNNIAVKAIAGGPAAPTLALAAGGSVDVGSHYYGVSLVGVDGSETIVASTASVTTTSGNQTVNITAIPTGPAGVTKRNVYRSKVGTSTPLFLVATINDNTTTTYSDAVADLTLPSTKPPAHSGVGGSLVLMDSGGAVKARIYGMDGAVSFDNGALTSDGSGNVTAVSFMGKIQTNRNGTNQANTIYTGTNTPTSPAVGDLWAGA